MEPVLCVSNTLAKAIRVRMLHFARHVFRENIYQMYYAITRYQVSYTRHVGYVGPLETSRLPVKCVDVLLWFPAVA